MLKRPPFCHFTNVSSRTVQADALEITAEGDTKTSSKFAEEVKNLLLDADRALPYTAEVTKVPKSTGLEQKVPSNGESSGIPQTTLSTLKNRYITPQNQLMGARPSELDNIDTTAIHNESDDENSHLRAALETRLARPKRKASANVSFEDQGGEIDNLLEEDTEAYSRELADRKRVKLETFDDPSGSIPNEEPSSMESTPVPEPPRKRGRPKKGEERTKVKQEVLRRSRRAVDRPQKYVEDPAKPVSRRSAEARLVPSRPREAKEPLALYKSKRGERQKPFVVDTERLYNGHQRDRRLRINTLDVLRQVVVNFTPSNRRSSPKDSDVGERYRVELLSYLDELSDTHASIKNISQDITDIQRQKNELRTKIYNLRNDHVKVGDELNALRATYNESKKQYDNFGTLNSHFEALSGEIGDKDGVASAVLAPLVDSNIYKVSRLVNPHSGLLHKLQLINTKLQRLHDELA